MQTELVPRGGRFSSRLSILLDLMRPRTCFLSVFTFLVGVNEFEGSWTWRHTLALIASFLVSALANLHNASTDYVEDKLFLPGRKIAIESLGDRTLKSAQFVLASILLFSLTMSSVINLGLGIVGILFLFAYSSPRFRLKEHPVLGSLDFAMVGVLPYIGGVTMGQAWGDMTFDRFNPHSLLVIFMLLLTKFCIKNLPDYEADKQARIRTSATIFRSYKHASVFAVAVVYAAYGFYLVALMSGKIQVKELTLVLGIIILCLMHVLKFLLTEDLLKLNSYMKWDMFCSALFFSSWSYPGVSRNSLLPWLISLGFLIFFMFMSFDSRIGSYLNASAANQGDPRE